MQSVWWESPIVSGDKPEARSGHSFTSLGDRFILFGGSGRGANGKAQAFNDVKELDTSVRRIALVNQVASHSILLLQDSDEYKWKELVASNPPPPRARHAALALDDRRVLVFGGINKRIRYSDVWVLDIEEKAWKQIEPAADPEFGSPEPRAHFSSTRFGTKIFIFGGYLGSGIVSNDLWILHTDAEGFRWENITTKIEGTGPTPRFDHSCFKYPIEPNSSSYDKLVIMGGRDLSTSFNDSHMLDLSKMCWENDIQAPCLPFEVSNNVCDGIESVPFHKVFSFGGKKGMMQYLNSVDVMDAGSQIWSTPPVDHGVAPEGREDCAWAFDVKTCSLLIFGGWANRWLGDLIKLNVSPIIGPPYACTGIEPDGGPVFGSTELIVKGLRFKEQGKIQVKFGNNEKNEVIVDAEYVDAETIKVRTPNYESYGALSVDVKVSIGGEGWTVNKVKFGYFANTSARNCIAYGPGLLDTGIMGIEMPFLIQSIDTQGEKRTTGGDTFAIRVVSPDGKIEGAARVSDLHNGMYEVHYSAPTAGKYHVHVTFAELSTNEQVPIRGSPFTVELTDPWKKHRVGGATPATRKGCTLVNVGGELVLYGGDKAGVSVCTTAEDSDWKWSAAAVSGDAPPSRTNHTSTILSSGDEVVVFGGVSMDSGNELNDLYYLSKNEDGWSWSHPAESKPYIRHPTEDKGAEDAAPAEEGEDQSPPGPQVPLPVTARGVHAAVAVDRDLYVFGGDNSGDLLKEFAICDLGDRESASWIEPILKGDVPPPVKGTAVVLSGNKIFMFGGIISNPETNAAETTDQLVVLEISGPNDLTAVINPPISSSAKPAPRSQATMVEYSPGRVFLYGGFNAASKPLNDGWMLDVTSMSWEMVYNGETDQPR